MSDRVSKIIETIDVGLQTPVPDPSFGEISPVNSEGCLRCPRSVVEGSDLCAGCRTFLLGDSDDDPADWLGSWNRERPTPPSVIVTTAQFAAISEAIDRAAAQMRVMFADPLLDVQGLVERTAVEFDSLVETELTADAVVRRRHGHAAVCPRHGETRGGTCLRCVR